MYNNNIMSNNNNIMSNNFFIEMLSSLDEEIYVNDHLKDNAIVTGIRKYIRKYLIVNCKHDLETDDIDVTPEQSLRITYCSKCNMNF
jgi:hypothetical protein